MSIPTFFTDEGNGIPLLLFHAFPLNAAMWEPQRRMLSNDCRVLTFDLPGFGRGKPLPGQMSMRDCADIAIALLDELRIDTAAIGGCSMGGYIAMAMLRHYPERVAALVLADTRAGADSEETRAGRAAQIETIRTGGREAVFEAMLPKLLGASTFENAPELVDSVSDMMRQTTAEGAIAMLDAMAKRPDSSDVLSSCTVPCCIIVGVEDVLTPPSESEYMAHIIHDAQYHLLPGCGHLSNLERPVRFSTVVRDFLASRVR